ncbi:2Fe-2S ferredoxin-like superfamily protein [Perilla frutescens var. hirtella]|nr:2Fe-2S ferredoxin-like superfamily protein [Perilla frutescens var. hirtella]
MAAFHLTLSLPLYFNKQSKLPQFQFHPNTPHFNPHSTTSRRLSGTVRAYKLVIEQDDKTTELEIDPDETILSRALDSGMELPHDCKLGVCMTCPARLVSGKVDQSDGMLSDDVIERGYALMCAAYPRSDCHIKIIPEEELLSLQLATAND